MNQDPAPSLVGPVMLDIEGVSLNQADRSRIAHPLTGGLILFSRNYQSLDQLQSLIREIRKVKKNIIIAVDHEGGRVQRFREHFSRIPCMNYLGVLYESDTENARTVAKELGWLMAAELRCLDIDISFAPVLDIDYGISKVIGDRAFSRDPDIIIELASCFMMGMREAGMSSTGKHFPGHGYVEADSHIEIPIDSRELGDIEKSDLSVFKKLANNGMCAVMPAHVIYPKVDSAPAGFSKIWVDKILRRDIGFDGVVFSDDLSMEGATVAGSFSDRAKVALEAGCDMVLVCNNPDAADEVLDSLSNYRQPISSSSRLKTMLGAEWGLNLDLLQSTERWIGAQRHILQSEELTK